MLPGWTPLITAVFSSRTNMVHCLLEAGADPNMAARDGSRPLIWAARLDSGDFPMVKDLLAHGARVELKDKSGGTALDYARVGSQRNAGLATILAKAAHP
jgi:ankyrin repeat protein